MGSMTGTKSLLVMHALEEHGGKKPQFLAVVRLQEPRPLYRAIQESMLIAGQPWGPDNLPVLGFRGRDKGARRTAPGMDNPRLE